VTGTVPPAPARQRWISVDLTAQRGDSHVAVYRNAASGKLLYEGTLERGQTRPFAGRRLWLLITAPANLVARVDGRRVQLPGDGSRPIVAVASAAGIAPAQAG
jgi:hypothetical protein